LRAGSVEFGVSSWRQIADGAVRADGVVVVFPDRQSGPRMNQRREQRFVQELVAKLAVEALIGTCIFRR